jgi:hypothetical protein
MRRLKWRELASVKAVYGTLSDENKEQIIFPTSLSGLPKPYAEMSVGVENIFKVVRIDAIWRLTNLSKNNNSAVRNFGIAASLNFTF